VKVKKFVEDYDKWYENNHGVKQVEPVEEDKDDREEETKKNM